MRAECASVFAMTNCSIGGNCTRRGTGWASQKYCIHAAENTNGERPTKTVRTGSPDRALCARVDSNRCEAGDVCAVNRGRGALLEIAVPMCDSQENNKLLNESSTTR